MTGDRAYAELAHRFDQARFFDPLAEGRDELQGLHANTTARQGHGRRSTLRAHGEERDRRLVEFFWRQVALHRSYCTGGTSNAQRWRTAPGILARELGATTQECCCTYNMLKLTRHLFGWNPEAGYADYYERAFLNGILGTMNPADGDDDVLRAARVRLLEAVRPALRLLLVLHGHGRGELLQAGRQHLLPRRRAACTSTSSFPPRLQWPEKGLVSRLETRFPDEEAVRLEFQCEKPVALRLRVRVPYWATRGSR